MAHVPPVPSNGTTNEQQQMREHDPCVGPSATTSNNDSVITTKNDTVPEADTHPSPDPAISNADKESDPSSVAPDSGAIDEKQHAGSTNVQQVANAKMHSAPNKANG